MDGQGILSLAISGKHRQNERAGQKFVASTRLSPQARLLQKGRVMATAKSIPIPELTQAQQERFWSHVLKADGNACWLWQASGQRYGKIKYSGRFYSSHRMAYHLAHGPIPDGLLVCHKCDNQKCCRPDHLFAGTSADNTNDMYSKGRANKPVGDRHGTKTMPHRVARGDRSGARTHPERLVRGVDIKNAKLNEVTVSEIRRLYSLGGLTQKNLGKQFGVCQMVVSKVVRRLTWRHVP
jgi:hypothetical protein